MSISISTDYGDGNTIISLDGESAYELPPEMRSYDKFILLNVSEDPVSITTENGDLIDGVSSFSLAGNTSVQVRRIDGTWRSTSNSTSYIPSGGSGAAAADLSNAEAQTALETRIPDEGLWLFPSFSGTQTRLQMLASGDGVNWRMIATDIYSAASLTLRDPSMIFNRADGWWYIAHSNVNASTFAGNVIRIIRSRDLINWTAYAGVTITGQTHAWSPEWVTFEDGQIGITFAASSTASSPSFVGFAIYLMFPSVAGNFSAWADPVEIFDAVNCIDPSIVYDEDSGLYNLYYKHEDTKVLEYATSATAAGPYTRVGAVNGSWAAEYEGASISQLADGSWRIYADKYTGSNQGYYYAESATLVGGWGAFTAITANSTGIWTIRHGTPIRLTGDATRSAVSALAMGDSFTRGLAARGGGSTTGQAMVSTVALTVIETSASTFAQFQLHHLGGTGSYKCVTQTVDDDTWSFFRGTAAAVAGFMASCDLTTMFMRWYGGWRAAFFTTDQQSLSGAGAVDLITGTTLLTTTGSNALTLANGAAGQRKTIIHVVDGGDGTLTPTTKTGYTTITFTAVGQSVTLEYVTTLGWMVVGVGNAAPTIA